MTRLVPWTALRPSARARRWRLAGIGISIASSLALGAAAVAAVPFSVEQAGAALVAAVAGVLAWTSSRRITEQPLEIGVPATGEIEVRHAESSGALAQPMEIVFAARWLISLRSGAMLVPIWPDSLPPSLYRRLWVHLRWKKAVRSDHVPGSAATGRSTLEDR